MWYGIHVFSETPIDAKCAYFPSTHACTLSLNFLQT
jgi:hypothetical protein